MIGVAKLLIFRGDVLHDERELTGHTLRIGRAPQNDVVLEDPGKGVSRNHAEIRREGGRYVLVDRESQNGIWVAGERVASVALGPDVTAALGPFRICVKEEILSPSEAETVADVRLPSAPLELDAIAPPPVKETVPPTVKERPSPPQQRGPTPQPRTNTTLLILSAAAAIAIAVVAFAAYKILAPASPPVWNVVAARDLVNQGRCAEAMETQITPALNADPNNQEALALRDTCVSPPSTTPPTTSAVPAGPTTDDTLNEAETLVAAKECAKALDVINGVLAADAANVRANDLAAKAKACLTPAPAPPVTGEKPVVAIPPSEGGLDLIPKEPDKAYKARIAAMRTKYDEVIALLENNRYQQALTLIDDIATQVPVGYLDLAKRREEARAGIRAEGRKLFEAGQAADKRDDFEAAENSYRRAVALDPALQGQVVAATKSMTERKTALGQKVCKEGRVQHTFGNNAEAIRLLQEAVRLLPQSDDCYAVARQILKQLGK